MGETIRRSECLLIRRTDEPGEHTLHLVARPSETQGPLTGPFFRPGLAVEAPSSLVADRDEQHRALGAADDPLADAAQRLEAAQPPPAGDDQRGALLLGRLDDLLGRVAVGLGRAPARGRSPRRARRAGRRASTGRSSCLPSVDVDDVDARRRRRRRGRRRRGPAPRSRRCRRWRRGCPSGRARSPAPRGRSAAAARSRARPRWRCCRRGSPWRASCRACRARAGRAPCFPGSRTSIAYLASRSS